MTPEMRLRARRARLSMRSSPKSPGMGPAIWLLLRSRCMREERAEREAGMEPDIWLSATLRTARRERLPMSSGMGPERRLPTSDDEEDEGEPTRRHGGMGEPFLALCTG
ncbi:hypothetical protein C4D60_Mb09t11490 [Musa balbisiana]|uniref:Uncharacterized protein n=1 Tax=Musa balbisiana TaxID=52838 RepID=A0A4S8IFM8_MUSBA|nr:hypothetical protein C4D60_Mb09t11490 [Musa balbisiana]